MNHMNWLEILSAMLAVNFLLVWAVSAVAVYFLRRRP